MTRTTRWITRTIACLPLTVILGGCGLSKPDPAKSFYAFEVSPPQAPSGTPREGALRVARTRVAPPFNKPTFHYLVAPGQYQSDYYVNFIAEPDLLLSAELVKWLRVAGPYEHAVDASSAVGTVATVHLIVTDLYADYTDSSAPAGVVRGWIVVIDESGVDAKILLTHDFQEVEPMDEQGSAELVAAWNAALERIFASITTDLANLPDSPPE